MSLSNNRLCVFCGRLPNAKTREHIVPYWLLELTGDPHRVVTLGQNYDKSKEPIRYSWSNFVAPACDECNNKFSELEGRTKDIIRALRKREALPVSAYIDLMDWLDKVRIGVWLLRHMIENHPIQISPNFHIASRIAEKDRMLAVYVFESDNKGINLFGTDSLIFNGMPSCFGCRINDLLLLNISLDFFCSNGCGFPHPSSMKIIKGGANDGKLELEGFSCETEVNNPITNLKLYKPVVWLYQPIKLPSTDPVWQGGYYGHPNLTDTRLLALTLKSNERQGALFRQFDSGVEILRDPSQMIEFDVVTGDDCAMQKDIAASVYELQIELYKDIQNEWIGPNTTTDFENAYRKLNTENATELAKLYRESS